MFKLILADLRQKALSRYESDRWPAVIKVLFTDGTLAMLLYRLMQWSHRWRLIPLAMLFNKLNAFLCNCIIGRGAEFGPGFVLVHSTGVVINSKVRGGSNVFIEHQVTLGSAWYKSPVVGNNVLFGAGAKVLGGITVGDGARIGANAVVVHDVPPHTTVVGIPARVVRRREPSDVSPGVRVDPGQGCKSDNPDVPEAVGAHD